MNGRIYDPEIGRFLSCDPYVQVPEFSQNFNRYSYVLNNPLTLTDPSGLDWLGDIGAKSLNWLGSRLGPTWSDVLVSVTRYVVSFYAGPIWGSTAASGLQAGLSGGSASDIRRAEAAGFAQGAALQGVDAYAGNATSSVYANGAIQTAGHAIVGGAVNSVMGGKFSDGFYSAAVANELGGVANAIGGYSNPIVSTISSAVIGGTATAVGGGKFANGAMSGAFQYLVSTYPLSRGFVKRVYVAEHGKSLYEKLEDGDYGNNVHLMGTEMHEEIVAATPEAKAAMKEGVIMAASLIPIDAPVAAVARLGFWGKIGRFLGFGGKAAPAVAAAVVVEQGAVAVLKNGYYEVSGFKFSEYYYNKLWSTGRGAPSLVAKQILESGASGVADATKAGFLRYEAAGWEMVFNPTTKEIWHLQPLR